MELSPQRVASATFRVVKRGFDPDEVRTFLGDVAGHLESTQQQATAMEARARAAVSKLHDLQHAAAAADTASQAASITSLAHVDEAETISRTLLLAQRTADTTVAEAEAHAAVLRARSIENAASIESTAHAEAAELLASARAEAVRLLDEARAEARRAKDEEHLRVENEVQALLARRDFLLADVDHLEQHVGAQRERVRDASVALLQIVERVPGGLADMRRPLLSASAGEPSPAAPPAEVPDDDADPTPVPDAGHAIRITGQVPVIGGEPLVSPRPTSVDEARTLWEQAGAADDHRRFERLARLDEPRSDSRAAADQPDVADDLDVTDGATPIAGVPYDLDGDLDDHLDDHLDDDGRGEPSAGRAG
jgi:DivIVA domain-containing protein